MTNNRTIAGCRVWCALFKVTLSGWVKWGGNSLKTVVQFLKWMGQQALGHTLHGLPAVLCKTPTFLLHHAVQAPWVPLTPLAGHGISQPCGWLCPQRQRQRQKAEAGEGGVREDFELGSRRAMGKIPPRPDKERWQAGLPFGGWMQPADH